MKRGLAKALLISLSTSGATLRQNRQVRQDASQVLASTDIIEKTVINIDDVAHSRKGEPDSFMVGGESQNTLEEGIYSTTYRGGVPYQN